MKWKQGEPFLRANDVCSKVQGTTAFAYHHNRRYIPSCTYLVIIPKLSLYSSPKTQGYPFFLKPKNFSSSQLTRNNNHQISYIHQFFNNKSMNIFFSFFFSFFFLKKKIFKIWAFAWFFFFWLVSSNTFTVHTFFLSGWLVNYNWLTSDEYDLWLVNLQQVYHIPLSRLKKKKFFFLRFSFFLQLCGPKLAIKKLVDIRTPGRGHRETELRSKNFEK